MDNGPAAPAKTTTRPRTYEDEKEKSGGPAGPMVHNKQDITDNFLINFGLIVYHFCSKNNSLIFCFMTKNQLRFVRTLTATWKVLRDPVLTTIYMKKWKNRKDKTQTIYGYVFQEMYKAA